MSASFALFETPLGYAAIAWNARGVCGVELPGDDMAGLRRRMKRRFRAAAEAAEAVLPAAVQDAIERISALLAGQTSDLSTVVLDMTGVDALDRQVYEVARTIPIGKTLSYGQVAARVGDARLAREVGQALSRNPFPIIVPCHRVIGASGKLGGFSARGGVATKQRLLTIERAHVSWQLPLGAGAD